MDRASAVVLTALKADRNIGKTKFTLPLKSDVIFVAVRIYLAALKIEL